MNIPISLPLSSTYDWRHAGMYWQKHRTDLARKLSNWHEQLS